MPLDPAELRALAKQLDDLVPGSEDRVTVAVETGFDEAFFVATPAAFVRLASALLRAAATDTPDDVLAGVGCTWTTHTHTVADHIGTVVVSAECVVATDSDRRHVMRYFQWSGGEL